MALLLGHDLGTRGNKAVLVDTDGRLVAEAVEPYGIELSADGRAEQDPAVWWRAVCACTRRVLEASGRPAADVCGIGFAGQMLALVPLDALGQPTRPAISWLDSRAEREAHAITRRLGGATLVSMIAGAIPTGKDIVAKIAWIRAHEPEVFGRTRNFGDATSYLVGRATGSLSIDVTCAAGTGMLDAGSRTWSPLLARLAGFPLDRVVAPREGTSIAGALTAVAASELGLAAGTPVIAGLADIPAAAIGSGSVRPGDTHVYLGTSGWLGVTTRRPVAAPRHGIAALPWTVPGTSLTIGEMENAGSCLDWAISTALFRGQALDGATYRAFESLAAGSRPGSHGVWFLPWLFGERSPFPNERLRGGWLGVGLTSSDSDLARSVYEGVAYNLGWSLRVLGQQGVRPPRIAAIGGGTMSGVWLQTIADVTGVEVARVRHARASGAIGAALCAGVGVGAVPSLAAIGNLIEWGASYEPGAEAHALHAARLPEFARLSGWMG
jgi:xylulokinase